MKRPSFNAGGESLRAGHVVPVLIVASLATISTLAFGTVFSSWNFLIPAAIGALAGSAITLVAQRFRLLFGEVLALSLILPIIVGPLVSFGPSFFSGLVFGWVDILSATPPADLTPALRALPFITAFVASVVGGEFLRPSRQSGLAVLGPIIGLVLTALFTIGNDRVHLIVGLSMVAGLLLLSWAQRLEDLQVAQQSDPSWEGDTPFEDLEALDDLDAAPTRRAHSRGLLLGLAVLVPVVALSPLLGPRLPFAEAAEDRLDLRELQTPPWDPLTLPSPLVELKGSLLSASRLGSEIELFTARMESTDADSTPVTRFRSATLVGYDGLFWSVAEADREADFVPVDTDLPQAAGYDVDPLGAAVQPNGADRVMTVTPLADLGNWVPVPGVPSGLDFATARDVRMSLSTSTIGLPGALETGGSYEVTFTDWPLVDDGELFDTFFSVDRFAAEPELLPPTILTTAADFTTGFGQLTGARIIAIRDQLLQGSYNADMPPGHSYGPLAEMLSAIDIDGSDPENLIYEMRGVQGNEEQYAAVAGLLVRLSDIPVRVATGWIIPEDRWANGEATVLASDVNAWIEVLVDGAGWVPVDVTPDRAQEPIEIETGTEEVGVPVADPPKEPPPPDDAERPDISDAEPTPEPEPDPEPEEEVEVRSLPVSVVIAVSLLVPLVLLALAGFLIVGLKRVRRRRRRSAETASAQIAGAWAEMLDRVGESGTPLPARSTPRETAIALEAAPFVDDDAASRLRQLADRVSASAFHPVAPGDDMADAAWQDYDQLAAEVRGHAKARERLRMSVDPRPLIGEQLSTKVRS